MTAISRTGLPGYNRMPQPYKTINPVHAFFLRLLGPSDCWDSPLVGTKYDPYYQTLRHREQVRQRRLRAMQRRQRHA